MAYKTIKWPKLKRDRIGMKVRLLRTISNCFNYICEGSICEITHWYHGATLVTEPCQKCGVGVRITKVKESDMEPVEI